MVFDSTIQVICKVLTKENIVDALTKPNTQSKYDSHIPSMGIEHMGEYL